MRARLYLGRLAPLLATVKTGILCLALGHSLCPLDLGLSPTILDPALYFKRYGDGLVGLQAYMSTTRSFVARRNHKASLSRVGPSKNSNRASMDLTISSSLVFTLKPLTDLSTFTKSCYISQLTSLPLTTSFDNYRSLPARLAWLEHSSSDLFFVDNMASQFAARYFLETPSKLSII